MSDFTKEELERLLLEVDAGLTKAKQSHGKLMWENSELRRENAHLRQQLAAQSAEIERLRKDVVWNSIINQPCDHCGKCVTLSVPHELAALRERLEAAEKMLCQCGTQDEPTLARFEHAGFYVDIDRHDDGWWAVRFRYTSIERKGPHGSPIEAYQFAIAAGWLPPASTNHPNHQEPSE